MQGLVGALADGHAEVREACAEALPRLLGYGAFVRAIGDVREGVALGGATLCEKVVHPICEMMRTRAADEPQISGAMLRTLARVGCERLYANDECRGVVLVALCERLEADELSAEYGDALRELERLAAACDEAAATRAPLATLCGMVAPALLPEVVWWLRERPRLVARVAHKLLDCSEAELLARAVPHALPQLVQLGARAAAAAAGGGGRARRRRRRWRCWRSGSGGRRRSFCSIRCTQSWCTSSCPRRPSRAAATSRRRRRRTWSARSTSWRRTARAPLHLLLARPPTSPTSRSSTRRG